MTTTPPDLCHHIEVLALIDHYIKTWPDDAQVLTYLREALVLGLEPDALTTQETP